MSENLLSDIVSLRAITLSSLYCSFTTTTGTSHAAPAAVSFAYKPLLPNGRLITTRLVSLLTSSALPDCSNWYDGSVANDIKTFMTKGSEVRNDNPFTEDTPESSRPDPVTLKVP
jgi:hypothetical protein